MGGFLRWFLAQLIPEILSSKAFYILGDSPVLSRALEWSMVQRSSDFQHCVPRYQLGCWSWVVFSTCSFFGNSLDLSVECQRPERARFVPSG